MNNNDPNSNSNNEHPQDSPPFDYQQHYRQQNQQYNQPYNAQYHDPQQPPKPPIPPVPQNNYQYNMGDNARVFSILSYISILWLVGLLADKDNPKVRFHVNQGIILTIFEIAINVAVSILKSFITAIFSGVFSGVFVVSPIAVTLNGMLTLACLCLFVAFSIIGILHAVQDREEPLPVIGTLFQILK